jgi:hypothetical protein
MDELGVPIPPPYDDVRNWPFHRWCTFEQAGGMVNRITASCSRRERRALAEEYGVSVSSIRDAVKWRLIHTGEYSPKEWKDYERRVRADSRRKFIELQAERHRQMRDAGQMQVQAVMSSVASRASASIGAPVSTSR